MLTKIFSFASKWDYKRNRKRIKNCIRHSRMQFYSNRLPVDEFQKFFLGHLVNAQRFGGTTFVHLFT